MKIKRAEKVRALVRFAEIKNGDVFIELGDAERSEEYQELYLKINGGEEYNCVCLEDGLTMFENDEQLCYVCDVKLEYDF